MICRKGVLTVFAMVVMGLKLCQSHKEIDFYHFGIMENFVANEQLFRNELRIHHHLSLVRHQLSVQADSIRRAILDLRYNGLSQSAVKNTPTLRLFKSTTYQLKEALTDSKQDVNTNLLANR